VSPSRCPLVALAIGVVDTSGPGVGLVRVREHLVEQVAEVIDLVRRLGKLWRFRLEIAPNFLERYSGGNEVLQGTLHSGSVLDLLLVTWHHVVLSSFWSASVE
jgi:hypothetical protein